jgi:hypothetical protein
MTFIKSLLLSSYNNSKLITLKSVDNTKENLTAPFFLRWKWRFKEACRERSGFVSERNKSVEASGMVSVRNEAFLPLLFMYLIRGL